MENKKDSIRIGLDALELLKSETFNYVLNALQEQMFETWKRTPTDAKDAREDLYYTQLAIAHIEDKLRALADNAKVEQIALDRAAEVTQQSE